MAASHAQGSDGAALHGGDTTHAMPSHAIPGGMADERMVDDPVAPHSWLHASLGPLAPPMQKQPEGLPYDWENEHRFPTWVMQRPPMPRSRGSRIAVFTYAAPHADALPGYPWDAARAQLAGGEWDLPGSVQGVAASHYFSVALASGRVWTFGSGFNGELGCQWTRSSVPHPVDGDLKKVHADYVKTNVHAHTSLSCWTIMVAAPRWLPAPDSLQPSPMPGAWCAGGRSPPHLGAPGTLPHRGRCSWVGRGRASWTSRLRRGTWLPRMGSTCGCWARCTTRTRG